MRNHQHVNYSYKSNGSLMNLDWNQHIIFELQDASLEAVSDKLKSASHTAEDPVKNELGQPPGLLKHFIQGCDPMQHFLPCSSHR